MSDKTSNNGSDKTSNNGSDKTSNNGSDKTSNQQLSSFNTTSKMRSPRWAVAAMFVLNGGLYGTWAARIPSIQQHFDFSPGDLGLLLLLLAGGAIAAFPLSGALSDRFGPSRVTLVCALVYCPALVMIGYSSNVAFLAISIFIFGAAHGAMDVAMNGWAAEVERWYGRSIMSSFHALFSVGAGIGAGFGAIAAWEEIGYSLQFSAFAMMLAPLIWFSAIPPKSYGAVIGKSTPDLKKESDLSPKTIPHETRTKSPKLALPKGALLVVALVAFSCAVGEGAMADWSAVFLATVIQASEGQAALGFTVFSISMVTMRFAGDRIITRFGPVNTLRFCGVAALVGSVITATATILWVGYIGLALMGVGYSIVFPLVFSRAANSSQLSPGVAIASVAIFGYGGLLLGPPMIGFVAEISSLRFSFGIFVLLSLVLIIGAAAFRQKINQNIRPQKESDNDLSLVSE
ncbi:MAG: MFS transporter [Halopseudomonas aestusnigri]